MALNGVGTVQVLVEDMGVQRMLARMAVTLSPPSLVGFLEGTVDPYIHARARSRFKGEGDDVSGKWMELSQVSQDIRASQNIGAAHPINVRTGQLEDYITGTPGGAVPDGFGAVLTSPGTPPSGEPLLTKVQTAQAGKSYPKTVARPVMGVNQTDLATVLTELGKFISIGVAI